MLEKIHASHLGIEKCTQPAREALFWQSMTTDIRTTVLDCAICLEHRNANQKEPLYSYKIPDRPWQTVATDLFHWNNVHYVVLVDLYSRYFEVSSLRDTGAQTVINKLKSYFSARRLFLTMDHNSVVRYLLIFARNGTSDIHLQAPIILKLTPQIEQLKLSRICSTKLLRIKKTLT